MCILYRVYSVSFWDNVHQRTRQNETAIVQESGKGIYGYADICLRNNIKKDCLRILRLGHLQVGAAIAFPQISRDIKAILFQLPTVKFKNSSLRSNFQYCWFLERVYLDAISL